MTPQPPTAPAGSPGRRRRARPDDDRGLAAERTALAWNRSGLALVVCLVLLFHRIWPLQGDAGLAALALVAAGAGLWIVAMRAAGRQRGEAHGRLYLLGERRLRLISLGTLALAVAGLVIGLLPLP